MLARASSSRFSPARRLLACHGSHLATRSLHIDVAPEVRNALAEGRPVVALESTIISHGMPFPRNLEVARDLENVVRAGGAVPATVAVIHGVPRVGLSEEHLTLLATQAHEVRKASTRDLAFACAKGLHAATTVASTMKLASLAGVRVFATGGIGGVHRGAEISMDVSADLLELARTPVTVVCAGIKSILDIGKSLEVLETQGVPVVGFQTRAFPSFFTNSSGFFAPATAENAQDVAQMMRCNDALQIRAGMVVAVPNPQPADEALVTHAIADALAQAEKDGVHGAAITPYLLARIERLTGGKSLDANIALVKNNARVAAEIASHYARLSSASAASVSVPILFSSASNASTPLANAETQTQKETAAQTQGLLSAPRDRSEVVVVGGAVMDIIGRVAATLTRPHTSNPGKLRSSPGGVGRNIASSLGRAGVPVLLATALGDDDRGRALLHEAHSLPAPMDTSLVMLKTCTEASTASYCAIHDSNGDLHVGLADMGIFSALDAEYIETLTKQIENTRVVVADGNLPVEGFAKLAELCETLNKPLFFEPTSDFKCVLPFQAKAFGRVTMLKPNVTELVQMVSYALQHDLIRSGKAHVSSILADIVSNRIAQEDPSSIDLVDLRVLVSALHRVLCANGNGNGALARRGVVNGKHIFVSLGKRGVLWCGPTHNISAEEKQALSKTNQLVISANDSSMTCHIPAEEIPANKLKDTNGAGDNFCAGLLQAIVETSARDEAKKTLNSSTLLPNTQCIEAGLFRSRNWLLRFSEAQ